MPVAAPVASDGTAAGQSWSWTCRPSSTSRSASAAAGGPTGSKVNRTLGGSTHGAASTVSSSAASAVARTRLNSGRIETEGWRRVSTSSSGEGAGVDARKIPTTWSRGNSCALPWKLELPSRTQLPRGSPSASAAVSCSITSTTGGRRGAPPNVSSTSSYAASTSGGTDPVVPARGERPSTTSVAASLSGRPATDT